MEKRVGGGGSGVRLKGIGVPLLLFNLEGFVKQGAPTNKGKGRKKGRESVICRSIILGGKTHPDL